jgi:hypothetical protein
MSTAPLPRDTEGDIVTSAEFGLTWLVRIFYNTDPEGVWVEEGDWSNVTLHGEFTSQEEAEAWMEAYPDGDRDLKDMDVIAVNRVRPAPDPAPVTEHLSWCEGCATTAEGELGCVVFTRDHPHHPSA